MLGSILYYKEIEKKKEFFVIRILTKIYTERSESKKIILYEAFDCICIIIIIGTLVAADATSHHLYIFN